MKNVLVTGGAGFIGCNFIRYLLREEPAVRVINLDALTYAGRRENLAGLPASRHELVVGDICDRALVERLLRERAIDTIVHFAAESHVDRSIHGPAAFVQTNVVGTFTLLESARTVWSESRGQRAEGGGGGVPVSGFGSQVSAFRFHHVSTDEVYGSLRPGEPAFTESTPYDPSSPYSASKAASDHLVRAYARTYGLPVTISNCSNNYGPYQFPEKLIPLMILNAVEGKPLPVYGDGMQIRDWLYVEDHCEALLAILRRGRLGETYNIGGDNQPPNIEIVRAICDLIAELHPDAAGQHPARLITHVPDRPGHDRRYAMDITKIRRELDWTPRETLASGLRKTVQWYLDHPEWVAAIRQQPDYTKWLEKNYRHRATTNGHE